MNLRPTIYKSYLYNQCGDSKKDTHAAHHEYFFLLHWQKITPFNYLKLFLFNCQALYMDPPTLIINKEPNSEGVRLVHHFPIMQS